MKLCRKVRGYTGMLLLTVITITWLAMTITLNLMTSSQVKNNTISASNYALTYAAYNAVENKITDKNKIKETFEQNFNDIFNTSTGLSGNFNVKSGTVDFTENNGLYTFIAKDYQVEGQFGFGHARAVTVDPVTVSLKSGV